MRVVLSNVGKLRSAAELFVCFTKNIVNLGTVCFYTILTLNFA